MAKSNKKVRSSIRSIQWKKEGDLIIHYPFMEQLPHIQISILANGNIINIPHVHNKMHDKCCVRLNDEETTIFELNKQFNLSIPYKTKRKVN